MEQLALFAADEYAAAVDVHDLLLPKGLLEIEQAIQQKKAAKPVPWRYECAWVSGADCAIRRSRTVGEKRKSELMVLLVSQKSYYIRNENTQRISPVTEERFATFFSDDSIEGYIGLSSIPWVAVPERFSSYYDTFRPIELKRMWKTFSYGDYDELIKRGLVLIKPQSSYRFAPSRDLIHSKLLMSYLKELEAKRGHDYARRVVSSAFHTWYSNPYDYDYDRISQYQKFEQKTKAISNIRYIQEVATYTNLDFARKLLPLIERYDHFALRNLTGILNILTGGERDTLNQKRFVEYALNENTDISAWYICLRHQEQYRGELISKYPAQPVELSQMLVAEYQTHQYESKREAFEQRTAEISDLAWVDMGEHRNYTMLVPQSPGEIVDEGTALHHCVGSFIDAHTSGMTAILFMRKADNLSKPFATVEVRNGKVRQAFKNHNSALDEDEMGWLKAWGAAKGVKVPDSFQIHGV